MNMAETWIEKYNKAPPEVKNEFLRIAENRTEITLALEKVGHENYLYVPIHKEIYLGYVYEGGKLSDIVPGSPKAPKQGPPAPAQTLFEKKKTKVRKVKHGT